MHVRICNPTTSIVIFWCCHDNFVVMVCYSGINLYMKCVALVYTRGCRINNPWVTHSGSSEVTCPLERYREL